MWGVFAFYQLVRRVWDEPRALAGALMLALIPGAFFIDRSFLPDPAMLALTLTAAWMYVAYLQTGRRACLALAGAVGALAFLTKLPGIISLVPLAYATVAVRRAQGDRPPLKPIVLTLAIVLVTVAAYYAWAVYLGTHYPPYHVAGGGNWVFRQGVRAWLAEGYYLEQTWVSFRWWLWTAPVIALLVLGAMFSPKSPADADGPKLPWFFHFWAVGCVVLFLVGARELQENPWNLHVFNPVAAAFAGQGWLLLVRGRRPAEVCAEPRDRRPAASAACVIRGALIVAFLLYHGQTVAAGMYRPHARDSFLMGQALGRLSREGETVVTIADDVGDPIAIYYCRRQGWVFPPADRQDL